MLPARHEPALEAREMGRKSAQRALCAFSCWCPSPAMHRHRRTDHHAVRRATMLSRATKPTFDSGSREQGDAGGDFKTPVEWLVLFICHSNPEKPPYACQTATCHL